MAPTESLVKPERVAVAILSWNGRQHLETCLAALAEQKDPGVPWEILVLDNGSSDGTAGWLRREHPRVRLIESPTNLGFCAGNNRLMNVAAADAVALLNNDTRPRVDWLVALVDAFAAAPKDVAAVSGMIVDWSGERLDFGRGLMTFDGHALQDGFRRPLAEAEVPAAGSELLFPCGGNVLIRRESFLAAGGGELLCVLRGRRSRVAPVVGGDACCSPQAVALRSSATSVCWGCTTAASSSNAMRS